MSLSRRAGAETRASVSRSVLAACAVLCCARALLDSVTSTAARAPFYYPLTHPRCVTELSPAPPPFPHAPAGDAGARRAPRQAIGAPAMITRMLRPPFSISRLASGVLESGVEQTVTTHESDFLFSFSSTLPPVSVLAQADVNRTCRDVRCRWLSRPDSIQTVIQMSSGGFLVHAVHLPARTAEQKGSAQVYCWSDRRQAVLMSDHGLKQVKLHQQPIKCLVLFYKPPWEISFTL